MFYEVKAVESLNWSEINSAAIDKFPWLTEYCPKSEAKLAFIINKGLYIQLTCHESSPKAVYTGFYQPVYKDSCLEFFASFGSSGNYINCEMNSNGALLMGIGSGRHGRTRIDELIQVPSVKAVKQSDKWTVELFLSIEDIKELFDFSLEIGSEFKGNLYKCGDETDVEHYGVWSPVISPKPDFHRPECFGLFKIV